MSVVRRDAQRRWAMVGSAVAVLCLLPLVMAAVPSPELTVAAAALRDRIMASADRPYEGYADTRGSLGLPELPVLGDFTGTLSGNTRLRAWYASPKAWRVATLATTGETDTYRTSTGTYIWDFERNLITQTVGEAVRLPWAADLIPPDLARRLLRSVEPSDQLESIAARRVAGVVAAGLRWRPSDPATTVGLVQVWADPQTGLPLQVEISGRDDRTVLTARFLEVDQRMPRADLLLPSRPESAGVALTTAQEVTESINMIALASLPAALAGMPRVVAREGTFQPIGVGAYGQGLSMFAVVSIFGRVGSQSLQALREGGGVPVAIAGWEAYEAQTALVSALIMRSPGQGRNRRTYVLAGSVSAEVLRQAGADLANWVQVGP